jgi:trehalose synthase
VMVGFTQHVPSEEGTQLILAGPEARSVADDPEGAQVLDEMEASWRELPRDQRRRVHLACLPMTDIDENAAIVNALQRQATIVVQKSIEEGFGLTVSEAMWKSRPVVASAVGGIQDQIEDGVTGILLEDPSDLEAFGKALTRVLADPSAARKIGERAREHVRSHFLVDRHALQYVRLLGEVLA